MSFVCIPGRLPDRVAPNKARIAVVRLRLRRLCAYPSEPCGEDHGALRHLAVRGLGLGLGAVAAGRMRW